MQVSVLHHFFNFSQESSSSIQWLYGWIWL